MEIRSEQYTVDSNLKGARCSLPYHCRCPFSSTACCKCSVRSRSCALFTRSLGAWDRRRRGQPEAEGGEGPWVPHPYAGIAFRMPMSCSTECRAERPHATSSCIPDGNNVQDAASGGWQCPKIQTGTRWPQVKRRQSDGGRRRRAECTCKL